MIYITNKFVTTTNIRNGRNCIYFFIFSTYIKLTTFRFIFDPHFMKLNTVSQPSGLPSEKTTFEYKNKT